MIFCFALQHPGDIVLAASHPAQWQTTLPVTSSSSHQGFPSWALWPAPGTPFQPFSSFSTLSDHVDPATLMTCFFTGQHSHVFGHQPVLTDLKGAVTHVWTYACANNHQGTYSRASSLNTQESKQQSPLVLSSTQGCSLSSGVNTLANDSLGKHPVLSVYTDLW